MTINELYPPVKGSSGGPITWKGDFGFRVFRTKRLPGLDGLGCQHGLGIVMIHRNAVKFKDGWKVVEEFQRFAIAEN